MDRNTLLAFFLIALVLLFTPKYMEIFSPQKPVTENEQVDLLQAKTRLIAFLTPKTSLFITLNQKSFLALDKKDNMNKL